MRISDWSSDVCSSDLYEIPHMLFINKMDTASARVLEVLEALQSVSGRPLVLRHVPIRDGEAIAGYVDLASERAYRYKPGEPSDLVSLPGDMADRNAEARQELLETLADFDDSLQIGRAHVCTPVTTAHLVCGLLLA